jgi:hypothetical protein
MADPNQIKQTLDELEPGTEVRIVTTDGEEVTGTYETHTDNYIGLEGADDLDVADVERVVIPLSHDGPE